MSTHDISEQRLRALAHPVRAQVLRQLSVHSPSRVTDVAAALGIAPNSISFHLRQLEKYGFARRATPPAGSPATESWWEAVDEVTMSVQDIPRGRAAKPVLDALRSGLQAVAVSMIDDFVDRVTEVKTGDEEPHSTTLVSRAGVHWLTDDEAIALGDELQQVLARHLEGKDVPRGGTEAWSLSVTYFRQPGR